MQRLTDILGGPRAPGDGPAGHTRRRKLRGPCQSAGPTRAGSLRLALLAPEIVEAILGGWADQRVMLKKLERPLPVGWEEQRLFVEQLSEPAGGR